MNPGDLRPSALKLHAMLPKAFTVRIPILKCEPVLEAAEVLTREGAPTGLDPSYPGFGAGLAALVRAGRVLHWGDVPVPDAANEQNGRIERLFTTVRPDVKGVDE